MEKKTKIQINIYPKTDLENKVFKKIYFRNERDICFYDYIQLTQETLKKFLNDRSTNDRSYLACFGYCDHYIYVEDKSTVKANKS